MVGGDCTILLGIFPALRRHIGPARLVDGHPDFLDGPSSDTGETADMDLAVLTGAGTEALTTLAGTPPMVSVDDVVLLGHRTRDLDDGAAGELARLPPELHRLDAEAVAADPAAAGRLAERWLAGIARPVRLHLDLDVLDPETLPAVTYPQPQGIDWDQLVSVMQPLARSPRLIGVSIADFRPGLDPTGELATQVVDVLDRSLPQPPRPFACGNETGCRTGQRTAGELSRHGSFLSWLVLTATDKPPRRNARSTGRPDNSACCPVGLVRHQRPTEPTTMTNQPDRGLSAITGEWRQLINLV